jgi:hypothetical protein
MEVAILGTRCELGNLIKKNKTIKMKKYFLVINLFAFCYSFGQTTKMELKYGAETEELNQILSFQNMYKQSVKLSGSNLNGKYYQIFVKEYKANKLVNIDTLFDGSETSYFNIEGDSTSFEFFAQTANNELKVQIMTPRFNSKKLIYKTFPNNHDYALKDFLGEKKGLDIVVGKPFYAFAIITPTIHKNGSGSYCEVAQSDTDPEDFGTKFKIPHYFLVQIVVK